MLLLLALWGCDPARTALPEAPPPIRPALTPLVSGSPATVSVHLPVGAGVSVAFAAGRPGSGPCPPALSGACLSVRAARLLGRATTDASGRASLVFTVTEPAWSDLGVQPVVFAPLGARLVGMRSATVLAPGDDGDHDGLTNALEVAAGADPARRDSDNGGVDDGQEVRVDHTDPLAPADDVDRETWCDGSFDDDHDGRVDCADPDCDPICGEGCFDRRDNDLNGLVDCADPVCAGRPECVEDCYNRRDDNRDGLVDCEDPSCPACVEVCGNGVDDDLDFAADCFDLDCGCVEVCGDGIDNDADGLADCDDVGCPCAEDCGNGRDDDRDLAADCADDDCLCLEACEDGVDGDGDGLSGCADPDCACGEVCDNGVDDDADGLVDCEDAGCTDLCVEDCDNGADDDGDLWTDCQDEECWSTAGCEPDEVLAWVRAGTLRAEVSGWSEIGSSCAFNGRGERRVGVAEGVAGRVRVVHDGRAQTCDWRVDRVDMLSWHGTRDLVVSGSPWTCYSVQFDVDEVARSGFRVDPACGLTGSGFLPQRLRASVEQPRPLFLSSWQFDGAAVAKLPDGRAWYRGDLGLGLYQQVRSYGWGDSSRRSSALSRPLGPTVAFGVCEVGAPALTPDATAPDGVRAECAL